MYQEGCCGFRAEGREDAHRHQRGTVRWEGDPVTLPLITPPVCRGDVLQLAVLFIRYLSFSRYVVPLALAMQAPPPEAPSSSNDIIAEQLGARLGGWLMPSLIQPPFSSRPSSREKHSLTPPTFLPLEPFAVESLHQPRTQLDSLCLNSERHRPPRCNTSGSPRS